MKETIKELWYGRDGAMDSCGTDDRARHLYRTVEQHREGLLENMTDAQKALFEKHTECMWEIVDRTARDAFG